MAVFAVMALVISVTSFVFTRDDDDSQIADRATTTTTTTSASTTAPDEPPDSSAPPETTAPPQVDEAELVAVVRDLQEYVEKARGLEFTRDVVVELAADAEFEERLLADFEEGLDDLADAEVFYRALALLQNPEPLADQLRDFYSQGVLGFYDTETDELVVRGADLNPYVRSVIVHELVHALDDQHFELYRPKYDELTSEVPLTFSAVVEGNANRIKNDWIDEQPESVQDEIAAAETEFSEGMDIDDVAYVILFELAAPYQFGEIFVNRVVSAEGERGVDEALITPPETSEQVVFPEVYEAGEPAIAVPAPKADGEVVVESTLGALLLFGYLSDPEQGIDPIAATRAVDGWGGDRYVTWTDGDANCVRMDIVGDTDEDTTEIRDALAEWTERRGIGQVSEVDGRVRLESCSVFAGGIGSQA